MFADAPASQYVPVIYDVSKVSCPVAIIYGGSDYLGEHPPRPTPPAPWNMIESLQGVIMSRSLRCSGYHRVWWPNTSSFCFGPGSVFSCFLCLYCGAGRLVSYI